MPIHLIYGDNYGASNRAIEKIIENSINPTWSSFNLSRLDGAEKNHSNRCLEEIRTPPFGEGARVVLLKRSSFCNGCSNDLSNQLQEVLDVIPSTNHLILNNLNKPDQRLKTTKAIKLFIKSSKASSEQSFMLPPIWDQTGQKHLVEQIADELNLQIEEDAVLSLVEAIGNDSSRIYTELQKLSLFSEALNQKDINTNKQTIDNKIVKSLVDGLSTNSLEVANLILKEDIGGALNRIDSLIENGEPPLRILATLIGQARGWLWVKLLVEQGQQDAATIAKLAGIANPKRIYVIRKQINRKSSKNFINLLIKLLEIEGSIKKGIHPNNAFKDSLLTNS